MIANEGGLTSLNVYASGNPQPDVYWRKGRGDIDTRESRFRILPDGSLQVMPVSGFSISFSKKKEAGMENKDLCLNY